MKNEKYYTSSEIIQELDISLRQLYYWELKGIIKPEHFTLKSREFKRYSHKNFEILQMIKCYIDQGYTLTSAVQMMNKKDIQNKI